MVIQRRKLHLALALVALAAAIAPAGATTLVRMGLDDLVSMNESVIVGRVVDIHSRWNEGGTFILTDVRMAVDEVLKGGRGRNGDLTFTVMGGTVGDKTVLIVGGVELEYGSSYALFLSREDLPGAPGVVTVRDHGQGAFTIVETPTATRAVSQASQHPLLADWKGISEAPGGAEGIELNQFIRQVRDLARAR